MVRAFQPLLLLIPLIGACCLLLPRTPADDETGEISEASTQAPRTMGVASCAASACHGGTRPNERTEYTTWVQHDRHAKAYLALFDKPAQQIAKNLNIAQPHQDNRCLVCHATAPDGPRDTRFAIEDGVSCEACHGPAERSLASHSKPDGKTKKTHHDKYERLGMKMTTDVAVRASVCVTCHVGSTAGEVNHDLIAAGHPPLVFELDAYTANMPPHWKETSDKPAAFGAQAWAGRQAVVLKQSLDLLAKRATTGPWPEFAAFECSACHHELGKENWRQDRVSGGRRPGGPVWTSPQWMITKRLATSPGDPLAKPDELANLRRLLSRANCRAAEVAEAAEQAATGAASVVQRIQRLTWEPNQLRRMLTDLASAPPGKLLDHSTASHITMALGAVFEAAARRDTEVAGSVLEWAKRVRPALDRIYDDVQAASGFDPIRYEADLKSFRALVTE